MEQITYSDLASAKAARAKVDAGTSFADLAKQKGLSAADIQIGTLTQSDLGDRGGAVFAVPIGGVTQPLKAPVGYALIHVVTVTPGTNKSLADVKADILKQLTAQLAASKIADIANRYIDENSRGESISKAAAKVGMHVGHIAAIDAHGNTPDGSKAPIPQDQELLAQMFKAEVGEEGDPFQAKSGTTFVVKVDGVRPPRLKALETVRTEATSAWQKEQLATRLAAKPKQLADEATAQKSLSAVAASVGATVQKSAALRRPTVGAKTSGPLPRALLTKIFGAAPGTAVYAPNADGSSLYCRSRDGRAASATGPAAGRHVTTVCGTDRTAGRSGYRHRRRGSCARHSWRHGRSSDCGPIDWWRGFIVACPSSRTLRASHSSTIPANLNPFLQD